MGFNYAIDDHDCVVKVASLDQVVLVKHLQLMKETERPARCNLFFELPDVCNRGMLAAEHGRIVVNHHRNAIIVERQRCDLHIAGDFAIKDSVLHFEKVAKCILLFRFGALQRFNELDRASIHDGALRSVELDHHVVDLKAHQRSKCMLDGAYPCTALFDGCSSRNVHHIIAVGIDHR